MTIPIGEVCPSTASISELVRKRPIGCPMILSDFIDAMCPRAAVYKQHPFEIEGAAVIHISQDPFAGAGIKSLKSAGEGFRPSVCQDYTKWTFVGKNRLSHL